jgi:hypothetical protein
MVVGDIDGWRETRYSKKIFRTAKEANDYMPEFIDMLKKPKLFDVLAKMEESSVIELDLQD